MNFQISPLEPGPFAPLFALPPQRLAEHLAVCQIATTKPGFFCRVSMQDAEVGESVLLIRYTHQAIASPYQASHAIFVRKDATRAILTAGEVPEALRSRVLSLRAFDKDAMIVTADLCERQRVESVLAAQLSQPRVAYVHIHFARFGCYAARADRV